MYENCGDPDQTPCSVASDLGMHCLPMSHKKDGRLIWVKVNTLTSPIRQHDCKTKNVEMYYKNV